MARTGFDFLGGPRCTAYISIISPSQPSHNWKVKLHTDPKSKAFNQVISPHQKLNEIMVNWWVGDLGPRWFFWALEFGVPLSSNEMSFSRSQESEAPGPQNHQFRAEKPRLKKKSSPQETSHASTLWQARKKSARKNDGKKKPISLVSSSPVQAPLQCTRRLYFDGPGSFWRNTDFESDSPGISTKLQGLPSKNSTFWQLVKVTWRGTWMNYQQNNKERISRNEKSLPDAFQKKW